jgi:hypothetical protein
VWWQGVDLFNAKHLQLPCRGLCRVPPQDAQPQPCTVRGSHDRDHVSVKLELVPTAARTCVLRRNYFGRAGQSHVHRSPEAAGEERRCWHVYRVLAPRGAAVVAFWRPITGLARPRGVFGLLVGLPHRYRRVTLIRVVRIRAGRPPPTPQCPCWNGSPAPRSAASSTTPRSVK